MTKSVRSDLDKILSIKGVRDYYDDGEIDKKEFDELYQKILKKDEVVERLRKLISHLSQLYLDNKLENHATMMLLVVRDCVLNGKFDVPLKSWEHVLSTTSKEDCNS